MKRAALYVRVSTVDQHPETQLQISGRWLHSAATKLWVV
jgi:DNA invertase Pin-like site-specific DNA recombinase